MAPEFTHMDSQGRARMVDVGGKAETQRVAVASATLHTREDVVTAVAEQRLAKGDVLAVARVAGIMAAKRCADLIPLCHPLSLDAIEIEFALAADSISVRSVVKCSGKTGVEMEALTAASIAALCIYDMCKSMDRAMRISNVQLEEKSGGKSGVYRRGVGAT